MIIEVFEKRRIDEDDDGDGEEDDDVERVHHQPGHQQPPRPFLRRAQLRQTTLAGTFGKSLLRRIWSLFEDIILVGTNRSLYFTYK